MKQKTATIIALIAGVLFIFVINHITYGWTYYPPLNALGQSGLTVEKYNSILLSIQSIISIAIAFLLFKWYKLKNKAPSQQ